MFTLVAVLWLTAVHALAALTLTASTLCVVLGLLCLFLAAINVPCPRINLGWLGMFFCMLSYILPK
jgi:hypothetical protein